MGKLCRWTVHISKADWLLLFLPSWFICWHHVNIKVGFNEISIEVLDLLFLSHLISRSLQDCLLCPTGFAANMAFISALGSVSSLLVAGRKPFEEERIAIFSDALNHASIIDGIRLTKQLHEAEIFIYRHCDMDHLNSLLYVFMLFLIWFLFYSSFNSVYWFSLHFILQILL